VSVGSRPEINEADRLQPGSADLVGGTHPHWFRFDLALYFGKSSTPMTVISLTLTPFRVIDPRESELLRIEALFGLGYAVALRFKQPSEVAGFGIAASHQVAGDFGMPLLGSLPQLGFEILRVLLRQ
jgi:hypothetical protein